MSDREVPSPTLISLGPSRPRPRRNHKPSTPSCLSPTHTSLPSLFEDDQLAAFFPALSQAHTDLPAEPSSAPSVLRSNHSECYRYPSIQEEGEARDKETKGKEETKVVEEEGRKKKKECKVNEVTGLEDERRYEAKMEKKEEKEEGWNDGIRKEEEEEDNKARVEKKEEEEVDKDTKTNDSVTRFSSVGDENNVFYDSEDATCPNATVSRRLLTSTPKDSPPSPPLIPRPSSHPSCLTPDTLPESYYTADDTPHTELLSSPQSACEDEEHLRFVFPPRISRLGSIYSHLGLNTNDSTSDSESESGAVVNEVALRIEESRERYEKGDEVPLRTTTSETYCEKEDAVDRKHWSAEFVDQKEAIDGAARVVSRHSQSSSRSSLSPLRSCGQTKKVAPAKPPRLRGFKRISNNEDKRRSREDPVRYKRLSDQEKMSSKRSVSMNNILESNFEAEHETRPRYSGSLMKEVTGLLHSPAEPQETKDRRGRLGSFRYKNAAKIVSNIMSKKPPFAPFLYRMEHSRSKRNSPKKTPPSLSPLSSPPSSPPPTTSPVEEQKVNDMASEVTETPRKPQRKDLDALTSGSLEKAQEICSSHGALLHFYCVKCRVVVCRDCTVVAHTRGEHHNVLDTLDSLATLRSEAVGMLRHYTVLNTMHASLMNVYRRFTLQHRDVDIDAMGRRLEEGKYLGEVVKEAQDMVTTWTNLHQIRQCVSQWEARQDEWGDLVFLSSRCALLADMCFPSDTVLLRMGSWVMPTPWIQLSHLLQPYLRTSTPSLTSSSSSHGKDQLTPSSHRKGLDIPSSLLEPRKRSGSPYSGGKSTGGTDQPFPYNARQMVLSNLVPYIILNPDIRYFVHVGGPRDVDLTLVVVPVNDHARDSLQHRRNASKSPEVERQANHQRPMDAITLVEQQMTCGSCKTRITAYSMPLGPSSNPALMKISFTDVKVVSEGHGLPAVKGGVKRGEVIVDHSSSGRSTLAVVVRDIRDFPGQRLGHVTWGMEGLTCLVGSEDTKRAETSGLRAKIKATVKREEEAMYDVMFGMDL